MKYFRYIDLHYAAPLDEYDRPVGSGTIKLKLLTFNVIKHTPKGVWLDCCPKRWVANGSGKRFAHETEALALDSFIARKRRQVTIYQSRLASAEKALTLGCAKKNGIPPSLLGLVS